MRRGACLWRDRTTSASADRERDKDRNENLDPLHGPASAPLRRLDVAQGKRSRRSAGNGVPPSRQDVGRRRIFFGVSCGTSPDLHALVQRWLHMNALPVPGLPGFCWVIIGILINRNNRD